jgi:Protein of unknown function (DUF3237)
MQQPYPFSAPQLEPVMQLCVTVGAPIEAGLVHSASTQGGRRIIPITGGTVTGLANGLMNGRVLDGGADFQMIVSSTLAVLDARYMLELDNGARVFVQNHALRRGSAEDIAKLARGEPVNPEAIYFRCAPSFEVSDPALTWLTESLFIGVGARFPNRVEMQFFRVC